MAMDEVQAIIDNFDMVLNMSLVTALEEHPEWTPNAIVLSTALGEALRAHLGAQPDELTLIEDGTGRHFDLQVLVDPELGQAQFALAEVSPDEIRD